MNAVPHREHQDLALALGSWLLQHWNSPPERKVFPERNVSLPGCWPDDYRIPDLVLTTKSRSQFDQGTHIEGPPLVCVEIHSPNDESYEKLEFYARLGVPEIWIIDRDTKRVELFVLGKDATQYQLAEATDDGWLNSQATGIALSSVEEQKLAIRMRNDLSRSAVLPEN